MERRKSFEEMASYLRGLRPRDFIAFDRMVSLVLAWFDSHKIRELPVFLEQEGREYALFTDYLTEKLGEVDMSKDFVLNMYNFSRTTR
jgi:hypothetical protein